MYLGITGYVRSVYGTIDVRRVSLCAFYGTVPPKHSVSKGRAGTCWSTASPPSRAHGLDPFVRRAPLRRRAVRSGGRRCGVVRKLGRRSGPGGQSRARDGLYHHSRRRRLPGARILAGRREDALSKCIGSSTLSSMCLDSSGILACEARRCAQRRARTAATANATAGQEACLEAAD